MVTHAITQWGKILAIGSKSQCKAIAHRWTMQHGNIDLEVNKIDSHLLNIIDTPTILPQPTTNN
jgi:hypothetical protein